ncbi:MAG: transposase [Dechloromonas sp.]|nr:transposase [Candidatus Dechloromonas phosphoritropha]MBL0354872.1 transposase [Candidatus Dechloromonas phosphoritropha]
MYGEGDEICFPFFASREFKHVEAALGLTAAEGAVLLSDGYQAYSHYAAQIGITHAQCWAHTRRKFFDAQDAEPEAAAQALALIGDLYQVEERIREQKLTGARKRDYRLEHAKPIVERFFAWVGERFAAQGLLPRNPLTRVLAYARDRRWGLEVFLADPDVPIDTNHLERALRVIPMGRRSVTGNSAAFFPAPIVLSTMSSSNHETRRRPGWPRQGKGRGCGVARANGRRCCRDFRAAV